MDFDESFVPWSLVLSLARLMLFKHALHLHVPIQTGHLPSTSFSNSAKSISLLVIMTVLEMQSKHIGFRQAKQYFIWFFLKTHWQLWQTSKNLDWLTLKILSLRRCPSRVIFYSTCITDLSSPFFSAFSPMLLDDNRCNRVVFSFEELN